MKDYSDIVPSDLAGIYKDIAECIGVENAYKIYENFCGQQVVFPRRFYSIPFVQRKVKEAKGKMTAAMLGREYGYSERRIRQLQKE